MPVKYMFTRVNITMQKMPQRLRAYIFYLSVVTPKTSNAKMREKQSNAHVFIASYI